MALVHNPASGEHAGVSLDELEEVIGDPGQHAAAHYGVYGRAFASAFNLQPGANALVVNGRLVGPFENYAFQSADLASLVGFELEHRVLPVVQALFASPVTLVEDSVTADLYALACSVVQSANLPDPNAGMFAPAAVERSRECLGLAGKFR